MDDKPAMMTVRLDSYLKAAFEKVAKDLDLTPSQMIRRYIRNIVEQHAAKGVQPNLDLSPIPHHQPAAKKPAKGQKMNFTTPSGKR